MITPTKHDLGRVQNILNLKFQSLLTSRSNNCVSRYFQFQITDICLISESFSKSVLPSGVCCNLQQCQETLIYRVIFYLAPPKNHMLKMIEYPECPDFHRPNGAKILRFENFPETLTYLGQFLQGGKNGRLMSFFFKVEPPCGQT